MAQSERQLPDLDSLSGLLLTLIALSGEFPTALINRLPSTNAYREKIVKSLKAAKFLRTYYHDGLRGLRLTASAKRLLSANWPDRFDPLFSHNIATSTPKYTVPSRLRLHRMAEVLVIMLNAGVPFFPWEKPAIFQPLPLPDAIHVNCPAYYTSREVKDIGPQSAKIRGSRATGVLLTDGAVFAVYNTAGAQMKWEYKAEVRLKALLQIELCQRRLSAQFVQAEQSAIVFGSNMDQMAVLMGAGGDGRHNYFVLDGSFDHFYYLTSDHAGEFIL